MNTEDETELRERIASLTDKELVRTVYLFELVKSLEADFADLISVLWPGQTKLLELNPVLADIWELLKQELAKRTIAKSQGAP